MQADQHNYQPDKRFTDRGWNEMLKTLDMEMPVQEKKRRGFFWFFPFLLVGAVASVWIFYPNDLKTEITQNQRKNASLTLVRLLHWGGYQNLGKVLLICLEYLK